MSLTFVKKAVPFDAPKIYNLIVLAYAEAQHTLNPPGGIAALRESSSDILKDMGRKNVLVCTKNGNVIGTVRYQFLTGANGSKLAYISRLCVLPAEQRSGVGSQLLQEAEMQCREAGVDMLALYSPAQLEKLVRFYYANGFYIYNVFHDKGYARALFIKSLTSNQADLSPVYTL